MTNRHFRIFIKVVECGKMSAAARELGITQSSISQAISDIEQEFNVKLFERFSKSLFLTPIGKQTYEYAKHLIDLEKQMTDLLSDSASTPHIRIGATATVGACIITNIVDRLTAVHKNAVPEIYVANTSVIQNKLINSELDIGLVEGNITNPELIVEPVITDNLVIICGRNHKFWGRTSVSLEELADEYFIFREEGSATRAQLEIPMINHNIPYKVRFVSYYSDAIKKAVIDGYGISVISDFFVKKEFEEGRLWKCTVKNLSMTRSFDIVYRRNKFFHSLLDDFKTICKSYK